MVVHRKIMAGMKPPPLTFLHRAHDVEALKIDWMLASETRSMRTKARSCSS